MASMHVACFGGAMCSTKLDSLCATGAHQGKTISTSMHRPWGHKHYNRAGTLSRALRESPTLPFARDEILRMDPPRLSIGNGIINYHARGEAPLRVRKRRFSLLTSKSNQLLRLLRDRPPPESRRASPSGVITPPPPPTLPPPPIPPPAPFAAAIRACIPRGGEASKEHESVQTHPDIK